MTLRSITDLFWLVFTFGRYCDRFSRKVLNRLERRLGVESGVMTKLGTAFLLSLGQADCDDKSELN